MKYSLRLAIGRIGAAFLGPFVGVNLFSDLKNALIAGAGAAFGAAVVDLHAYFTALSKENQ